MADIEDAQHTAGGDGVTDHTPAYLRRITLMSWPELCALCALAEFPEARAEARRLDLDAGDFSTDFARDLAGALMDGTAIPEYVTDTLHAHDDEHPLSWAGSLSTCRKISDGVPDETAAIVAVRTWIGAVRERNLIATLRWAADEAESGTYSIAKMREVLKAHDGAGLEVAS